eukprot:TRINITY_DN65347_c0_g1_i1.p1 TRINITY_DN65347_c0_g1~~TRINITY_DN65347_c0_g1_i1.p1  ORF type:complete len:302 (-),score=7.56 TRINITY_DN65347_c0_g1_i1:91-996(-)
MQADKQEDGCPTCRICFDICYSRSPVNNENLHLISPCACTGSAAFVHLGCIRRWQNELIKSNGMTRTAIKRTEFCEVCCKPLMRNGEALSPILPEMAAELLPGTLLVATQMLAGPGREFNDSVILLCHVEPSGRRLGVDITRLIKTSAHLGLEVRSFSGGPLRSFLGMKLVTLLATFAEPGQREETVLEASEAFSGLYCQRSWRAIPRDLLQDLIENAVDYGAQHIDLTCPSKLLIFQGYAAWQRGQLEAEISRGAWLVCEANADDILCTPAHMVRQRLLESGRPRTIDCHSVRLCGCTIC